MLLGALQRKLVRIDNFSHGASMYYLEGITFQTRIRAGALVWWLREETHVQEDVSSNPVLHTRWIYFLIYLLCKNCVDV